VCDFFFAYHGQEDNGLTCFAKSIVIVSTNFDLWMSRGNVNTFFLIIHVLSET
jgi:hypothetical protein